MFNNKKQNVCLVKLHKSKFSERQSQGWSWATNLRGPKQQI